MLICIRYQSSGVQKQQIFKSAQLLHFRQWWYSVKSVNPIDSYCEFQSKYDQFQALLTNVSFKTQASVIVFYSNFLNSNMLSNSKVIFVFFCLLFCRNVFSEVGIFKTKLNSRKSFQTAFLESAPENCFREILRF